MLESLNFIGAGKLMYKNFSEDFNIPHLHFVVNKIDGCYQAIGLEFQLFVESNTKEGAIVELATSTIKYMQTVFDKGRGYEELIEKASENCMEEYWSIYREIEFIAAKNKKDIGNCIEQRIDNTIERLVENKMEEIIMKKAEQEAFRIDKNLKKVFQTYKKYTPEILYEERA